MARTASGCKLVRDPRTGIFRIRFTSAGKRWKLSTGRRDPGEAEVEAARLFSAVVSGERLAGKVLPAPAGIPFDEVAAKWLAEIESSVDPRTFELYQQTYVGAHFAPEKLVFSDPSFVTVPPIARLVVGVTLKSGATGSAPPAVPTLPPMSR